MLTHVVAKIATTAGLTLAALAVPTAAGAVGAAPAACAPDRHVSVEEVQPPSYAPIGPTAGMYNSGKHSASLDYSMTTTTERSTSWETGGGGGINWGIVQIEAHTNRTVTETVSKGITVNRSFEVPGRHYGYVTPNVQFRYFQIADVYTSAKCKQVVTKVYGTMKAITASPFFTQCVTKSDDPCMPG